MLPATFEALKAQRPVREAARIAHRRTFEQVGLLVAALQPALLEARLFVQRVAGREHVD